MMARPWAKATAVIPLRPAPPPTTAAAPAPMNTNAKVPMSSARSFGAIRSDIVLSRDELTARRDQLRAKGRCVDSRSRRHGRRGRRPVKRASLLRGDHLRREIDADRLRDAGAVFGVGRVAVGDLPLDDLDRLALHRCLVVLEQLLLLVGAHQLEQVAGLTIVVIAVAVIVAVGRARDRKRRLAEVLVLYRAVERVRLAIGIRVWGASEPRGPLGGVGVHRAPRLRC